MSFTCEFDWKQVRALCPYGRFGGLLSTRHRRVAYLTNKQNIYNNFKHITTLKASLKLLSYILDFENILFIVTFIKCTFMTTIYMFTLSP